VDVYDFTGAQPRWRGGQGFGAAVIMAGGEGRRLLPITLDRPKPMIDIGGVPLLERQVRAMVASGLTRIYIATNYLGHVIEDHFGDGSEFGARIEYLREPRKLGTAGALSLLPEAPQAPILVINGDVLTTADFGKLLDYHRETKAFITVAAIVHRMVIPFGVLRLDGHRAVAIEEKPSENYLCNAGMYVLEPESIGLVAPETHIDMTEVVNSAISGARRVSVFPIHEYWADIGSPGDLKQVLQEFGTGES
jgi:NDP-sugar pyrophosphorylase family protein